MIRNLSKIAAMRAESDQEIDLLKFFAGLYRALKRNLILTILLPLAGLAAGIMLARTSQPSIKSQMLISTDLVTQTEMVFLADQIKKADLVSHLPDPIRSQVVGLSFEVVSSTTQDDLSKYLNITVNVTDPVVLSDLQKALVNTLNELDRIKANRINRMHFYHNMIEKIDTELSAMDKVKTAISNGTKASLMNPADLFVKSVDLNDLKLKYQLAIENLKSIIVVKGFSEFTRIEGRNTKIFGLIGFLTGWFILIIILAIQYFLTYYREYETLNG